MTFSVIGSVNVVHVKSRIPDEQDHPLVITHVDVYIPRGEINRVPSDDSKRSTVDRRSVRYVPIMSPRTGPIDMEYIKDLTDPLKSHRGTVYHNKVEVTGGPDFSHISVGKPGREKTRT